MSGQAAESADASSDAFSNMLKQKGIEAFSEASGRSDQKAMDNLLDADVLFSGGDGVVEHDAKRDRLDALSTMLRKQTQALQSESAYERTLAAREFLDDDLLLIDAEGVVIDRRGIADETRDEFSASQLWPTTFTDWVLHHSDNVAVASYVTHQSERYGTQTLNFNFLLVDTWIKRGTKWKLLGRQSIALHEDPPVVALSDVVMQGYTGNYRLAPGVAIAISQEGNALIVSVDGAKPVAYHAELRDVFFATGSPTGMPRKRIMFQRDKNGDVVRYVANNGLIATKGDPGVAQNDATESKQAISSIVLPAANLIVRHTDDVAVATFIHERITHYHDQVLRTKYRSTETWVKRANGWKMLALQSRALESDMPMPALSLKSNELDSYLGTYVATSGFTITISRRGDALAVSRNGDQPVPIDAAVPDYFTTPASARERIIFQRDANGHIVACVSRRDGRDLVFKRG